MRRFGMGTLWFGWLFVGLAAATLVVNRVFAGGLVDYQAMGEALRNGWERAGESVWYALASALPVRVAQTVLVAAAAFGNHRQRNACLVCLAAGFSAGAQLVLMTWWRGAFGLVLFLVSGFLQEPCYLLLWGMIIWRGISRQPVRELRFGAAAAALFGTGIFLEVKIAPLIWKFLGL